MFSEWFQNRWTPRCGLELTQTEEMIRVSEYSATVLRSLWKQEETLAKWSLRRSFSVLRSADQTAGARRSKIKQKRTRHYKSKKELSMWLFVMRERGKVTALQGVKATTAGHAEERSCQWIYLPLTAATRQTQSIEKSGLVSHCWHSRATARAKSAKKTSPHFQTWTELLVHMYWL